MDARELLQQLDAEISVETRALAQKQGFAEFLRKRLNTLAPLPPSSAVTRASSTTARPDAPGRQASLGSIVTPNAVSLNSIDFASIKPLAPDLGSITPSDFMLKSSVAPLPKHLKFQDERPSSLRESVERATEAFIGRDFSAADVHEVLNQQGVELPEERRSAITTILGRMTEAGHLVRTHVGAGSNPNRYRLATPMGTPRKEEEDDVL